MDPPFFSTRSPVVPFLPFFSYHIPGEYSHRFPPRVVRKRFPLVNEHSLTLPPFGPAIIFLPRLRPASSHPRLLPLSSLASSSRSRASFQTPHVVPGRWTLSHSRTTFLFPLPSTTILPLCRLFRGTSHSPMKYRPDISSLMVSRCCASD
jgi:hypothetical protein